MALGPLASERLCSFLFTPFLSAVGLPGRSRAAILARGVPPILELMPDRSTARIPGQLEAEPLQLLARRSVVRLAVRLAEGRLIEVLAAPEAGRRDQVQDRRRTFIDGSPGARPG